MDPLRTWLVQRGFYGQANANIVFLDGGKAFVPNTEWPTFYRCYARCIDEGILLHAVERTQPSFHMFLDVDLGGVELPVRREQFVGDVVAAVNALMDDVDPGRVVVCGKLECAKQGFHVIWPDVVVNQELATCLHSEAIHRLSATGYSKVDLQKVLDRSVYRSGLRMLWSHKGVRGERNDFYRPLYSIQRGETGDVPGSVVECLKLCSIFSPQAYRSNIPKSPVPSQHRRASNDAAEVVIPPEYGTCRVRTVVETDGLRVLASSSRYCANVERCHRHNHVYFVCTPCGIYQKCHSANCTGFTRYLGKVPDGMFPLAACKSTLELVQRQRTMFTFAGKSER